MMPRVVKNASPAYSKDLPEYLVIHFSGQRNKKIEKNWKCPVTLTTKNGDRVEYGLASLASISTGHYVAWSFEKGNCYQMTYSDSMVDRHNDQNIPAELVVSTPHISELGVALGNGHGSAVDDVRKTCQQRFNALERDIIVLKGRFEFHCVSSLVFDKSFSELQCFIAS